MRIRRRIGLLSVVAICALVSTAFPTRASFGAQLRPGQFDSSCNGGRGVLLRPPNLSEVLGAQLATLTSGIVIAQFSYGASRAFRLSPPVILEALEPNCTLDPRFANRGVLHLNWPGNMYGGVSQIAPANNGDLLVFGGSNARLIATELTPTGQINRSFGHNGWVIRALPHWRGDVAFFPYTYSLVEEADGTILMGSDNGCPHSCAIPRVYAFSSTGRLRWTYAPDTTPTSSVLPTSTELLQLLVMPAGTILVVAELEFTGCGTSELAALNQHGQLEAHVTKSLARVVASLPPNQLNVGLGYVNHAGDAVLTGFLFRGCHQVVAASPMKTFSEEVSAQGRLLHRFVTTTNNAKLFGSATPTFGAKVPSGYVTWTTNSQRSVFALRGFLPGGAPNRAFGTGGVVSLRTCSYASLPNSCVFLSDPLFTPGPHGDLDVGLGDPGGVRVFELLG